MIYDVLIIGSGPAGMSAALYLRARGKTCLLIGNAPEENPLAKAAAVENYAGACGVTGAELLRRMQEDIRRVGAEYAAGRVISVAKAGDHFMAATEQAIWEGKRVILAVGTAGGATLEQERELLGHGVSYCATCDGMLYRGKRAVVYGNAPDLAEEAALLHKIGVNVTVVSRHSLTLPQEIEQVTASAIRLIAKDGRLDAVEADGKRIDCDGLFILRPRIAPDALIQGLQTEEGYVVVDRKMRTNIDGIFAAGDCTGKPLQVAKAVGEGLVAAAQAAEEV